MQTSLQFVKKHILAFALMLILLIWGAQKIWPMIAYKYLMKTPSTHVETMVLKKQPGATHWSAMGTVKAANDIVVASEVSGTIEKLAVQNGANVKQGDPLIIIRHQDISANLERDQAIFTQKHLFYQRLQTLMAKHAISDEAVSQAKSAYLQAQAAVNADIALMDKYIIKAPFDGQIGIWQVDTGQLVQPGAPMVSLTALTPTYIDFMLPAKGLDMVKVGDPIQFTTSSYANQVWHGKVIALDPQLDATTRSVKFRAIIDNHDHKLVPRLFGDVTVIKPEAARLLLPQEAITYNPEGASVYVLKNNVPTTQAVRLGTHENNNVVIVSGLNEDDEVITAGMMKINPGAKIAVNKRIIQSSTPTSTTQQLASNE